MVNASRLVALAGLAMVATAPLAAQPSERPARPAAQPTTEPAAQPASSPDAPAAPAVPPIAPQRSRLAQSASGAAIDVWTLGAPGTDAFGRSRDERPAVLIVAGLQGHHTVGASTAEAVARQIGEQHADLLATHTVYVVPNLNPDGSRWVAGRGTPRIESGRVPASGDADHDGRADEDPAEDLNGDGLITQMRVRNPDPRWGLRANLIPDPEEGRLMREAKADKGEVGQWAVLTEGTDNDGDGAFNEDGGGGSSGGIDLGMNFPTHWPEFEDGAGRYPLSNPASLALVAWVQAHKNIVAVVVYDPHDTLVNIPATGQYGPEGSVPRGIEEGDKPYHQHVADAFKEITHMSGAPTTRTPGSFASWAYGDFGVFTFSTPVWVRPDQIKTEKPEGEGDAAAQQAQETADPKAAQRAALIAEGFPARVADFLVASPSERQAIMQQVEAMSEEDRAAMMQEVMSLTPAQQQRVMEAVRGGGGGGPPQGGRPPGGPPAEDDHGAGAPVATGSTGRSAGGDGFTLETIAQPAGFQPGAGGGGGGRRFGGGQPAGGAPGGPAGAARGTPAAGTSGGEDRKWLNYSDNDRNHEGFVEWTPFEHPQLGPVEIGGFVPGFRFNPPDSELARLADEQTAFLARLLPMLPDVAVDDALAERVGANLWRLRVRLSNPGFLPTHSAIGLKARRATPIIVQISTPLDRVLTGQRFRRIDSIEGSGGFREAEWLIQASPGEEVTLEVRSDVYGARTQTIRLGEVAR